MKVNTANKKISHYLIFLSIPHCEFTPVSEIIYVFVEPMSRSSNFRGYIGKKGTPKVIFMACSAFTHVHNCIHLFIFNTIELKSLDIEISVFYVFYFISW